MPRARHAQVAEHVVIAIGYGALCTLFERLALPLVYTSVLWLPAGVAFGVVYVRGYRTLPALFVGAVLGLLTRVVQLDGGTAPGVTIGETVAGVLLEALVVIGHAALGTWLVRRYVPDLTLRTVRDASRFLLLAGPVACVVGAILGPPAMRLRNIADADGELSVSTGWLAGDALGVLLLAPLVAMLAGPPNAWRGRRLAVLAGVATVTIAVVSMHTLIMRTEANRVERVFDTTMRGHVERAEAELARSERAQDVLVAAVEADDDLAPKRFARLARSVYEAVPGARVVEWIDRDGARRSWPPDITPPEPDAATVDRARLTARVAAAAAGTDVLLVRPAYGGPATPPLGERLEASTGMLVIRVDPGAMLAAVAGPGLFDEAGIAHAPPTPASQQPGPWRALNVHARTFLVEGRLAPDDVLRPNRAAFVHRDTVQLADRVLPVAMAPTATYLRSETFLYASMPLSLVSMLFAFTAGVLVLVLSGRTARFEELVEHRTAELARSERRYRSVVDSVAEAIFRVDLSGRIEFANRQWHQLLGGDEPRGRLLEEAIESPDLRLIEAARSEAAAKPGEVVAVEFRVQQDEERRWAEARMRREEAEETITGTIRDTTARHELESTREQFVSLVSHEFRTPVTVISGALQTIDDRERDELPPIANTLLPSMRSASARLLRLVDDMLLAARADAGTLTFQFRRFDLVDVVRACAARAAADADLAHLGFELELDPGTLEVEGDAERIAQLVDNLLSNAIKYTSPPGSIRLTLTRKPGDAVIEIRDEGLGISPEDQVHLFDRFWRSTAGASHASGTGLGLSISRQIAEAHGGTIGVRSEVGRGSEFRVRLPLAPVEDMLDD